MALDARPCRLQLSQGPERPPLAPAATLSPRPRPPLKSRLRPVSFVDSRATAFDRSASSWRADRVKSLTFEHGPEIVLPLSALVLPPLNPARYKYLLTEGGDYISPIPALRPRSAKRAEAMPNLHRGPQVKIWDRLSRKASHWDGLRRDPELWIDHGDCLIYLYAQGHSQRGPSFCVPFSVLQKFNCGPILDQCISETKQGDFDGSLTGGRNTSTATPCALYIPAPQRSSRESAFQWHLTTRNFFAFLLRKPLVGPHLGSALVDLQDRMQLFRSGQVDNVKDLLDYVDQQSYRDYVNSPDYALALLHYAEHYELFDVWVDAFAHCVGMNDRLVLSLEFETISRVTKALITRAYLEMDIHLGRVTTALTHFLEDDMSPTHLGLAQGARAHLDRFRSFLHSYYVEKFGYWPPQHVSTFSRAIFKSMQLDFQALYDYLVDTESSTSMTTNKPASGGICVLQNVQVFDERHSFSPLPHSMPLIPEHGRHKRSVSEGSYKHFKLGLVQGKNERYLNTHAALTAATNPEDPTASPSSLVREYMRFERLCALNQADEKVSTADARKVRWLLIYGTLQYLNSAFRAPKQVRHAESAPYLLCCSVSSTPSWHSGSRAVKSPTTPSFSASEPVMAESNPIAARKSSDGLRPEIYSAPIEPDCVRGDYFTSKRDPGMNAEVEIPAPLRIIPPLIRQSTIKPFKTLGLTLGSRRSSISSRSPISPHPLGLDQLDITEERDVPTGRHHSRTNSDSSNYSQQSGGSILPEGAGPGTSWFRPATPEGEPETMTQADGDVYTAPEREGARTPVLEISDLDQIPLSIHHLDESVSSAASSNPVTPLWDTSSSTSSQSSTETSNHSKHSTRPDQADFPCNSTEAEASGLLGGFIPVSECAPVPPNDTDTPEKQSSRPRLSVIFPLRRPSTSVDPSSSSSSSSSSPTTPRKSDFRRGFGTFHTDDNITPRQSAIGIALTEASRCAFDAIETAAAEQHLSVEGTKEKGRSRKSVTRPTSAHPLVATSSAAMADMEDDECEGNDVLGAGMKPAVAGGLGWKKSLKGKGMGIGMGMGMGKRRSLSLNAILKRR